MPDECLTSENITEFSYEGKRYEIVAERKVWREAAACAVERGGFLVEINDEGEQEAVFDALNNASLDNGNTIAVDGGNASYVWIGGNDIEEEGVWILDGDNDGEGSQFWMGDTMGEPVGELYNNWGNEPDNFGDSGQDALALALTDWPFGSAGQWNDLAIGNRLFFVIEFD